MFWCNKCEEELEQGEMYFDPDDEAFRCLECGQLVEYRDKY